MYAVNDLSKTILAEQSDATDIQVGVADNQALQLFSDTPAGAKSAASAAVPQIVK